MTTLMKFLQDRFNQDRKELDDTLWPMYDRNDGLAPDCEEVSCPYSHNHPDRVIRDIASKRVILLDHTTPHTVVGGYCQKESGACTHEGESWCSWHKTDDCPTLRMLALPYQDHPDYREEWKP